MAAFVRKVKTASGATAVQIAQKQGRRNEILTHVGSAHSDAELAALLETARERLAAGQQALDLGFGAAEPGRAVIAAKRSRWLVEAVEQAWRHLGFDVVADDAFFQLVLARLVEPTSMSDTARVIGDLGVTAVHRDTFANALRRCGEADYRDLIAGKCFAHAAGTGGLSLVLYDVTVRREALVVRAEVRDLRCKPLP